jgi:hypothetical protein
MKAPLESLKASAAYRSKVIGALLLLTSVTESFVVVPCVRSTMNVRPGDVVGRHEFARDAGVSAESKRSRQA